MSLNADSLRDAVALVQLHRDAAARDWADYDRSGEERAAILRHADLPAVCDALALLAGIAIDELDMGTEEFLAELREKLGGMP